MALLNLLTGLGAVLLAGMVGVAVVNVVGARRLERYGRPDETPLVSILVPARDEVENLRTALPALLAQRYRKYEVVIYDDDSSDGTAALVESYLASADGRLRLVPGDPVPAGWIPKQWACHRLSAVARGEILIFCDADVHVEPDALGATVDLMRRTNAAGLTVLSRQWLGGMLEHAVVPLVVHLPILALLPLPLVERTRAPSLATGNGQWFAFTRTAYASVGGHAKIRDELVDDLALARQLKRGGGRLVVAVSNRLISARMYRSASAVISGFEKNLFALCGRNRVGLATAFAIFVSAGILPWAALPWTGAVGWAALSLLLALRVLGIVFFHHSVRSLLLHPVGSIVLPWIALRSMRSTIAGTTRWKGRAVAAVGGITGPR